MARFVYRMQNILNLKEKLETQAKNEYSVAQAKVYEEERKLEELFARKAGYEQKLEELYNGPINVIEVMENQEAVEYMKYRIELQRLEIKKAEDELEIAREKLADAIKERKTQEKLKENAFEVFLEELKAQESKEIDELVSYRYGAGSEG